MTGSKAYKGEIHNWRVVRYKDEPGISIHGVPHGHPSFVNWVLTSQVVEAFEKDGELFVETQNSIYKLIGEKPWTD